jgi:hypothetical protein
VSPDYPEKMENLELKVKLGNKDWTEKTAYQDREVCLESRVKLDLKVQKAIKEKK